MDSGDVQNVKWTGLGVGWMWGRWRCEESSEAVSRLQPAWVAGPFTEAWQVEGVSNILGPLPGMLTSGHRAPWLPNHQRGQNKKLPQGTRTSGLPLVSRLQGLPHAHILAPTWIGALRQVSLHRPQLLPVLQLVDQLRSRNRTPCSQRKKGDTRVFVKRKKTSPSSLGLQNVDMTSE